MSTPADAVAYFSAKLDFETDCSDVYAALSTGDPGFVLIDTRSEAAWNQGHVRGAVHLPRLEIAARIQQDYPADTRFVVYCWGPGCNGATRSALLLSQLGYAVKEMLGGFEYWAREGLPVDRLTRDVFGNVVTVDGTQGIDPLTSPVAGAVQGSGSLPGVNAGTVFGGGVAGGAILGGAVTGAVAGGLDAGPGCAC